MLRRVGVDLLEMSSNDPPLPLPRLLNPPPRRIEFRLGIDGADIIGEPRMPVVALSDGGMAAVPLLRSDMYPKSSVTGQWGIDHLVSKLQI